MAHLQAEVQEVKAAAANWRELPLATVGKAAVFSAECFAWFCVGEIIGRGGTLTGYDY
jgi:F-type H+-transporting ATPase subunit g